MEFVHKSVLLNECIAGLQINPKGIYLDGTLGGAGHSLEILKILTTGKLIAIDKDIDAINFSKEKLKDYKDKIIFIQDDYKNADKILTELGIDFIDGILLDLGVSSYQIDNRERGFSYMGDAPLDMRMNQSQYLTAEKIVNSYMETELVKLFWEYGEEKFSRQIAKNIIKARPINTTGELVKIIENSIPQSIRWKGGNPCKKVFQAIRIEVNEELTGLSEAITAMTRRLNIGGRMCIITFHSLEDRIAKLAFLELAKSCNCPPHQPICNCSKIKEVELITKKPIIASDKELLDNPRSQSAKLRIIEKLK